MITHSDPPSVGGITSQHGEHDLYQNLFQEIAEGFALCELIEDDAGRAVDLRFVLLNPTFERVTGISLSDATGQRLSQVAPMVDRFWLELFQTTVRQRQNRTVERWEPALGRHFQVHVYPANGHRFAVLVMDTTQHKLAQEELHHRDQRFQLAMEVISGMVYEWDLVRGSVWRSRGIFDLVGIPAGEAEPNVQWWEALVHPEDVESMGRGLQAAVASHLPGHTAEYRVRHRGGRWIWVWERCRIIYNSEGQAGSVVGCIIDIDERKRIEHDLVHARAGAEQVALRLHGVLESMTEGIVIANSAGQVVYANPMAVALHHESDASQLHGDLPQVVQRWELYDLQGQPVPLDRYPIARALRGERFSGLELRVRRRQRDVDYIGSFNGTPVMDREGRLSLAIITIRDITAQKRSEEQLRQLATDLERRVEERTAAARALAADVTEAEGRERKRLARSLHDNLQQYHVALKFKVDLALRARDLEQCRALLHDMHQLVQQANEESRSLTAEMHPRELQEQGLSAAIESLAERMSKRYGLAIEVNAPPERLELDQPMRLLLFRAVQELLLNVVKHAQATQTSVTLITSGHRLVAISVRDNGQGFDISKLRDGSGLGLTGLIQRIERMGGRITVDRPSEGGSQVTVHLQGLATTAVTN